MDKNRNTSITLFVLMGLAFIFIIIYVFVILPKNSMNTLGSSDLVLDSPIQKWNLRYAEGGIIPFCQDDNEWLGIEVEKGATVYTASEGIVIDVEKNVITIEAVSGIYVQYSPIAYYNVFKDDFVQKGDNIGRVSGTYLNLRVKDVRREVYECPYNYLNTFAKSILQNVEEVMGEEVTMCECDSLDY
jgi:hypothetical protein